MKRIYYGLEMVFLLILAAAGYGWTDSVYTGMYVDATESNTAAAAGGTWNSGTGDTAGLWRLRDTFGNDTNLWQANGNTSYLGDCPTLATTISGLLAGFDYDMYLVFWNPSGQNIRLQAGVEAGSLVEFNTTNGTSTQTGGVDSDRYEYQGLIGTVRANGAGRAIVYVDDIADTYRSWYDGVTYQVKGVSNPTPADKAADIAGNQNLTLSWAMPTDPNYPASPNYLVTKHYLYIRKDDPNVIGGTRYDVTVASDPAVQSAILYVDKNAAYYWRVDESISNSSPTDSNTVVGTVWSFSTSRSIPSFDPPFGTQPVSVGAFENTEAVFTATAGVTDGEDADISYRWYKGDSGVTTDPVSDEEGHIRGALTSQLTIDVQSGDKASYWCRATNSNGSSDSDAVTLTIKRLLAHYKFDGDLNDSAGTNNGTMGSPSYTTGIDGSALVFDGSQYVTLSTSAYPNNAEDGGLTAGTVSLWVNANVTVTQSFFGCSNGTTDYTTLHLYYTGANRLGGSILNSTNSQLLFEILPGSNVRNGAWHMVTFVWDTTVAEGKVYIDGQLAGTVTATAIAGFGAWSYPLYIGAENNAGTAANIYTGSMDDFRVYNYPLAAKEVAQLYVDFVSGVTICPENPEYDFNNDCQTGIADLQTFVSDWLACNLMPQSACN